MQINYIAPLETETTETDRIDAAASALQNDIFRAEMIISGIEADIAEAEETFFKSFGRRFAVANQCAAMRAHIAELKAVIAWAVENPQEAIDLYL